MERQMPTGIMEAAHPFGTGFLMVLNKRPNLKIGPTQRLIHALLMENLRTEFYLRDKDCPDCAKAGNGVISRLSPAGRYPGATRMRDGTPCDVFTRHAQETRA